MGINNLKNNPVKKNKNKKYSYSFSNNSESSIVKIKKKVYLKSSSFHKKMNNISIYENKKISKDKTIMKFNDYELNKLKYEEALIYDKRSYVEYYISLLKTKHLLLFTFILNNDYNSKIIKICIFLFSFSLYYTVNALFFNDLTMHKIYEEQGNYNFIFQIPKMIYSSIISLTINYLIKYLSLTEKNISDIKKGEIKIDKIPKTIKCLKIKFILFFILSFLFLILFWYYLSSFCAVYKNTQYFLIQNTLFSFILSLVYPFFIYLIPGILRIPSLNNRNKNKSCMYKVSKIIQLF